MEMTLRDTIRGITLNHLTNNNGLLFGQCLSAVGWVNNTVPDCKNIIELPMCDVAGSGIAVGAALSGRRPILVIRYQDFITLGMSPIINYAAKAKQFFGKGVPIFVRLIADESVGTGPVHSGKLHNLFLQFPGLKIAMPINISEYYDCWNYFMEDDVPYIICEHRLSYSNTEIWSDCQAQDDLPVSSDITLYGISIARFALRGAQKALLNDGICCNIINIKWLNPFNYDVISSNKLGLVVDTGFENGGASQYAAYKLMEKSNQKVYALGLKDQSVGVTLESSNQTPSVEQIVNKVKEILKY
jgi:acetoin:2,6-dichlorophenolindophenol oxidoreductase subunit beta